VSLLLVTSTFAFALNMIGAPAVTAQPTETLWSEDFEPYVAGFRDDPAGTGATTSEKWSIDVSDCGLGESTDWFEVRGKYEGQARQEKYMEGRDLNYGVAVWTSETIDISDYTDIEISCKIEETGDQEAELDYIMGYYILDEGPEVQWFSQADDMSGETHWEDRSVSGLDGDELVVIFRVRNSADDERWRFDDVTVTGRLTPPEVTLNVDPDTLNLKSKGKWITAYIEVTGGGYDAGDIDVDSLSLTPWSVFPVEVEETLIPTADTYSCEGQPTYTHGAGYNMYAGWDDSYLSERPYIKFDLSGIPDGSTIDSAVLKVYNKYSPSDGAPDYNTKTLVVDAREVEDDGWYESTLRWTNAPEMGSVLDTVTISTGWQSFDVATYIQGEVDGDKIASIGLQGQSEGEDAAVWFYTKDDSDYTSEWPRLELSYTYLDEVPVTKLVEVEVEETAPLLPTDDTYACEGDPTYTHGGMYDMYCGWDEPRVEEVTETVNIYPTDDSYIYWYRSDQGNFGTSTQLWVGHRGSATSSRRRNWRSYLKFDLSSMPSDVVSITLNLYPYEISWDEYYVVEAREVSDDWDEGTITYTNAPPMGSVIDVVTPIEGNWCSWDVGTYIQNEFAGDDIASIGLKVVDEGISNEGYFYSKEQGDPYKPYLEVTYTSIQEVGYGAERPYIKFDLSSIPSDATIDSATLNVYNYYPPDIGESPYTEKTLVVDAKEVSVDTWTEETLNWNNKPAMGSGLDTVTIDSGGWQSFDATTYVASEFAGDKTVSIGLQGQNEGEDDAVVTFNTKESWFAEKPYLEVEYRYTIWVHVPVVLGPEDNPKYGFVSCPELVDTDGDYIWERMVKFDRQELKAEIAGSDYPDLLGDVRMKVSGQVGAFDFEASDTIRLIMPGKKK